MVSYITKWSGARTVAFTNFYLISVYYLELTAIALLASWQEKRQEKRQDKFKK